MKTSARNQLKGTVTQIIEGKVNDEVVIDVSGTTLKAVITREAVTEMELSAGSEVYAIIKASFVMIANDKPGRISTRNVLETVVSDIVEGAVNCVITSYSIHYTKLYDFHLKRLARTSPRRLPRLSPASCSKMAAPR